MTTTVDSPAADHNLADRLLCYLKLTPGEGEISYVQRPARIFEGVETRVYSLRLAGGSGARARPCILRVFADHDDPVRARFEAALQNVLADLGYPAPRALLCCTDKTVLGGAFVMMERLAGTVALDTAITFSKIPAMFGDLMFTLPRRVAELQAWLHDLDANAVVRALSRQGLVEQLLTPRRHLERLGERVANGRLDGLRSGVQWLNAHYPGDTDQPVICHGDLWPGNIMVENGRVTGVIDWSMQGVTLGDAAYDVAVTSAGFLCGLVEMPRSLRPIARVAQRQIARRYLRAYARRRSVDPAMIAYFRLFRCVDCCSWVAERRRGIAGVLRGDAARNLWDLPGSLDGFIAYFGAHTGLALCAD